MKDVETIQSMRPPADAADAKLVDLAAAMTTPFKRFLLSLLGPPLEKALSLDDINCLYTQIISAADGMHFFSKCLDILGIGYTIDEDKLAAMPKSGPLVFVSNHPFGAIEGVMLGAILKRQRADLKILGNYLLQRIPEIRQDIIAVDPFGRKGSKSANLRGLRLTIDWLKRGGALLAFPAGEVSHFCLRQLQVADPKWSPHLGGIIRVTKSTVLPVYLNGRNSTLFQLAGMVHPRFRTALLTNEVFNKRGKVYPISVGKPLPWTKLKRFKSNEAIIRYLRTATMLLSHRMKSKRRFAAKIPPRPPGKATPNSLIDPVVPERLQEEVAYLPELNLLAETEAFAVYMARSHQIPLLLNEIGRLREVTFRQVGEGTGKAVDLDRFDSHYFHLFLWDKHCRAVAGAYRLGRVDSILYKHGIDGLYTASLFRFKPEFLDRIGKSLEIGRSFICSRYQKKYESLFLLWRGIGQYVLRHPQYKLLFGPVSISNAYNAVSKNLIVQFLNESKVDPELSRYVMPRRPYRGKRVKGIEKNFFLDVCDDPGDVSVMISEIEEDGKGFPVLLRHYLKLNANLICFNVDKTFSNAIDGLIVFDITKADPKLLKRLLGASGMTKIFRHHGCDQQPLPA